MKKIFILPSFERSFKKLSPQDKELVARSLERFNWYVVTGKASVGLGFKKIDNDKYEFRADIRLRIIVKVEGDGYYLVLAGSHDDIKRYLRRGR